MTRTVTDTLGALSPSAARNPSPAHETAASTDGGSFTTFLDDAAPTDGHDRHDQHNDVGDGKDPHPHHDSTRAYGVTQMMMASQPAPVTGTTAPSAQSAAPRSCDTTPNTPTPEGTVSPPPFGLASDTSTSVSNTNESSTSAANRGTPVAPPPLGNPIDAGLITAPAVAGPQGGQTREETGRQPAQIGRANDQVREATTAAPPDPPAAVGKSADSSTGMLRTVMPLQMATSASTRSPNPAMNTPMIQTTPHTDQQPGDANATATGLAQTTNRPSVTEDTSTPTVIGPVVTPVTGAVSRAVAAQLGTASSLDSATGPSPSDFVASNTVLRAAISGLQREGNGSYTITALLDPPSLGHVEAVIKVDDAGVSVSITAHSPEGHETLASHLDELRHELTSNGREVQLSLANGGDRGRHHEPAEHESAPLENGDENDTTTLTHLPAPTDRSLHLIL